ncbi:MAG: hypothetical protein HXY40_07595 [Chloroflexi bacterium]|nr:hypothetical protein [Chloroflexota bacterium]
MVSGTGKHFTSVSLGLALVGGLGVTLMCVAGGIGVIEGANADSGVIGLLFAGGLGLFIVGAAGWFFVEQPHKHFDDIEQPMYHGHEEHHQDEAHGEEAHGH